MATFIFTKITTTVTYSEARIAKDSDKISELNNHVWDSVDRIYLCKLSPIPVRRKRCEYQAAQKSI